MATLNTSDDRPLAHGEDELDWVQAALAAALAMLARIVWDEGRGFAALPPEREWEPPVAFHDLADLREHLACLAHDVWAALVEWNENGPANEPDVAAIVEEALSSCHERLVAMGWRTPVEAPRE